VFRELFAATFRLACVISYRTAAATDCDRARNHMVIFPAFSGQLLDATLIPFLLDTA
jgi:hypothetical protein